MLESFGHEIYLRILTSNFIRIKWFFPFDPLNEMMSLQKSTRHIMFQAPASPVGRTKYNITSTDGHTVSTNIYV